MTVTTTTRRLDLARVPAVVVGVLEGQEPDGGRVGRLIGTLQRREGFPREFLETLWVPADGKLASSWLLVVHLGGRKDLTLDRLRQAAAVAAKQLQARRISRAILRLLPPAETRFPAQDVAQLIVETIGLTTYHFHRFRKPKATERPLQRLELHAASAAEAREYSRGIQRGTVLAEAANYVRDLANLPGNVVTPRVLAEEAKTLAKAYHLRCEVLDERQLKRLGMGGLLGVGQGSAAPPRLIIVEYRPDVSPTPTVALVGKGITFDSGGISIKPSAAMEYMKYDKCGAVAVLGILRVVAQLKLPVHLVGLLAAAENLPSATAQRPGDIIRTYAGTTVEVLNTDAEGRLVLADALAYARKRFKPELIVDLATLTGACVVALGHEASGLFTRGKTAQWKTALQAAGDFTSERVWELPLWESYGESLKGEHADLKNIGPREAGAITAAYFLSHFVGDTPWTHLDIAGTAWTERPTRYFERGATGVGVRLITEALQRWLADREVA